MDLPIEETSGVVSNGLSVSSVSNHNLAAAPVHPAKISASRLTFHYGSVRALEDVSLTVYENRVTALIGHSGSGKSTFLRTLNRIHESMQNTRVDGEILLDGDNVLHMDVAKLRKRVGMVFQSCNPFPKSIFDNVAYGPRIHGYSSFGAASRAAMRDAVEQSLQRAGLWQEVKDRLKHHAYSLSVGQQQRLCIARALAINPEVLLLDEPCSALDPIATAKIEDLICELKRSCTILIVTHNMAQAKRIADYTGSLALGRLAQFDVTSNVIGKEFPEIHHAAHRAHD